MGESTRDKMNTQKKLKLLALLNEAIRDGVLATFDKTTSLYSTVMTEACDNGPQIQITINDWKGLEVER